MSKLTYKDSGVDINAGDKASKIAYEYAKSTFASREGMIGAPLVMDGGFSGALDFGKFLMVMNCDGVGTKIDLALEADLLEGLGSDLLAMVSDDAVCVGAEVVSITNTFDTNKVNPDQIGRLMNCDGVGTKIDLAMEAGLLDGLGSDLLAMVSDDAICVGAEVVSITNTFDTNKVNPDQIGRLMKSLATACIEQRVTIPGGEIAEVGNTVNSTIWNSTAIGIVEKDKFIDGSKLQPGDKIISLKEEGFRSNGFSLIRKIVKDKKIDLQSEFLDTSKTWAEVLLIPSTIYHNAILAICGSFGEESIVDIHGVVHITGGGLAGNLFRLLKKKGLGANLPDIYPMTEAMKELQKLAGVEDREAYKTWNGGNGMLIVIPENDVETALNLLNEIGYEAKLAGEITDTGKITHANLGQFSDGEDLEWEVQNQ